MVEVFAHCTTVKDSVAFLHKKEVELIFLDVESQKVVFDVLDNITYYQSYTYYF